MGSFHYSEHDVGEKGQLSQLQEPNHHQENILSTLPWQKSLGFMNAPFLWGNYVIGGFSEFGRILKHYKIYF